MSILKVHHRTTYRYDRPVGFGEHRWLFRPRDSHDQRLILAERTITPEPSEVTWIHDVFNNQIALVNFDRSAQELTFESSISLEHISQTGPRFRTENAARIWPFEYDHDTLADIQAYRQVHYPDPQVEEWALKLAPLAGVADTSKLLLALTHAVRETCRYTRRTDPGTQPPAVTLGRRLGTCRDFALLMMEAARYLGFAARFVTGYIYVPARDGSKILGGSATHAWVQIFLPGAGWVEFDPTNGIVGNSDLIRVGVARDPRQAKPLSGSFSGVRSAYLGMEIDVTVSKLTDNISAQIHDGAVVSFRG
ncbi:MAG: transglutaminase family protein [Devosia sp.]